MGKRIDLLSNASATGAAQRWPGGKGTFTTVGTFGGATVTLQFLGGDGSTWAPVGSISQTAAAADPFELAEGQIRAAVTGGAPSGLYSTAVQF